MYYKDFINSYSDLLLLEHPLEPLQNATTKDAWEIAVPVILSANCTDAAVNKIIDSFYTRYPEPQDFLPLNKDESIPILKGISHNGNKSEYIAILAQYLVDNGKLPNSLTELTKLKGFGRKTASIVLYHLYGNQEGIPLDTHCHRVLLRTGILKTKNNAEQTLLKIIPEKERHSFHLILTQFGRSICKAKNPLCDTCKFNQKCPKIL